MSCIHQNCKISSALEKNRSKLESSIDTTNYSNVLDSNIIKLSQRLDDLIVNCIKCKTTKQIVDILDINNTAGKHAMFFYYGKSHLLVCLARYIKHGIQKNEFFHVSIQTDWYKDLITYLKQLNIPINNIQYMQINDVIESYQTGGPTSIKQKILEMEKCAKQEGFIGVRIIQQCDYTIKLTSKTNFLKLEKIISNLYMGTIVSALCVYDFYDYINTSMYIEDDVMEESFETHTDIYLQD